MEVILTVDIPRYHNWANQFVAASSTTRAKVVFPQLGSSRTRALHLIGQAASIAGQGGQIIISVGHGSIAGGGSVGWIDLAPAGTFRLESGIILNQDQQGSDQLLIQRVAQMGGPSVCRALTRTRGPVQVELPDGLTRVIANARCRGLPNAQDRIGYRRDFAAIGQVLQQHRVGEVVFLTCSIGSATTFLTRIARDWQVTVKAYTERIVADDEGVNDRVRIYRDGHTPSRGSAPSLLSETEIPQRHVTIPP